MKSLVSIFLVLFLFSLDSYAEYNRLDSLHKALDNNNEDTIKVAVLLELVTTLAYSDPQNALLYAEQALKLSQKLNYRIGISDAYHRIGFANFAGGNLIEALGAWEKNLEWAEKLGDRLRTAIALANIGNIYVAQSDNPKALEIFLKVLAEFEEMGDRDKISVALGNIGLIYRSMKNYQMALEYYFKALEIDEELGSEEGKAFRYGNIGLVKIEQSKETTGDSEKQALLDEALTYLNKALTIDQSLGNKEGCARHLGNMAIVASVLANYPLALEYHFSALKIYEELNNNPGIALNIGDIGSIYTQQGKYIESEEFLLRAIEISEVDNDLPVLDDWHFAISELYEITGRYQLSYEHYMVYAKIKDSLFNEDKSKSIGKLEAKYEFEKAELERKRSEEELMVREKAEEGRRNNLQYSGILIFLVLVFAGVFMLGKFSIPIRLAEGMIFFSFLLFFEFTLVLLDPYIETYSSGAPAIKLAFNAVLAGLIFPLHSLFETKLKRRIAG